MGVIASDFGWAYDITTDGVAGGDPVANTSFGLHRDFKLNLGFQPDGIEVVQGVGVVGDDGGWPLTAIGVFGAAPSGVFVTVIVDPGVHEVRCWSGVQGRADLCVVTGGTSARFIVPPLPIGGPYDLKFESEDLAFEATLSGALTVIHRDFQTRLYSLRSAWPPPRDVGPYTIIDEDYGG